MLPQRGRTRLDSGLHWRSSCHGPTINQSSTLRFETFESTPECPHTGLYANNGAKPQSQSFLRTQRRFISSSERCYAPDDGESCGCSVPVVCAGPCAIGEKDATPQIAWCSQARLRSRLDCFSGEAREGQDFRKDLNADLRFVLTLPGGFDVVSSKREVLANSPPGSRIPRSARIMKRGSTPHMIGRPDRKYRHRLASSDLSQLARLTRR